MAGLYDKLYGVFNIVGMQSDCRNTMTVPSGIPASNIRAPVVPHTR